MIRLTEAECIELKRIKDMLHTNPELSLNEYNTTEIIKRKLTELGIELIPFGLPTGVVGRVKGKNSSVCIALRSDIDALSHTERADVSPISGVPGVMHGCGHDFHTTCLLGAAILLSKEQPPCDVLLVFQHAEEIMEGARQLVAKGLFDYPIVRMYGMHNRPEIDTGLVVIHKGPLMAAKDNFEIVIKGIGGHSSMPHKCEDVIVAAAGVISAINTIVSRNIDPYEAAVVSLCSIHGGTPENLPIDTVKLTGSIRSYDEQVRNTILTRIKLIVESVAKGYGCTGEFTVIESGPAVINSEAMYARARNAAALAMGEEAITDCRPWMASEDFAIYSQYTETFFYWLGVGSEENRFPWHNDRFHTDDTALKYGAELLYASVLV